jgi:hypothetical protein
MAKQRSFIRKGLEPIYIVPVLLLSTVYLILNGEATLGPQFGQYKEPLIAYLLAFMAFLWLIDQRRRTYEEHEWSRKWDLGSFTVLDTAPAIFAGVVVTFLILLLFYSLVGGGQGKTFSDMLVYAPYAIIAASIEEFMFRHVMVRAAPIRFKKDKHRERFAEIGSAVVFGWFHFGVALLWFGPSIQAFGMILVASFMGYIWTITVKLKTELKAGKIAMFFGLGFAIGSHVTWNLMATFYAASFVVLPFVFVLTIPVALMLPLVVVICVTSRITKKA